MCPPATDLEAISWGRPVALCEEKVSKGPGLRTASASAWLEEQVKLLMQNTRVAEADASDLPYMVHGPIRHTHPKSRAVTRFFL